MSESALCAPLDSIDSMPDGKDEDCDGKVDEDVDYRTRNCPLGTKIIQGTRGNDEITGTSGADCILGYGGNDTISGGAGNDTIFGGPGNDTITTGGGIDTVKAGKGADSLDATGCSIARLYGEAGPDTLRGGTGIDNLFGGPGNDVIVGGKGSDNMQGGDCNDLLLGDSGIDIAFGNAGVDACECETISLCEKKGAQIVDCDSNADCPSGEICASNVQFCVPNTTANMACNECMPSAANDVTCDGVDDDCDGMKDEDFVSTPTSCGVGACATTGMLVCAGGAETDNCTVTCEGACGDASDDDSDGDVDCADSDCSAAPECVIAPPTTDIGKPCTSDADCSSLGAGGACDTTFPGGYCFMACDVGNPAGECPTGSVCWIGSACVLPCGPGNTCDNPDFFCDGFGALGLPPDPFCRPSCAVSCPTGLTCDVNSLCM